MSLAAPDSVPPAPLSPGQLADSLLRLEVGKSDADESFPVASRFLPAAKRPAVLAFYRFARAADDIADSPTLTPGIKLAALEAADHALLGLDTEQVLALGGTSVIGSAVGLREVLLSSGIPLDHPRHLLQAFRKDAVQGRYRDWSELLLYCTYSAAPVGRFLLDLHDEDRSARIHSDPLCNAHQILNHVQDCKQDYDRLDRIYLPQRWLSEERADPAMLGGTAATPALRRVLDRMLDGADRLLAAARPLPGRLADRGLRMQASATLAMGRRLSSALRRRDPIAGRVSLGTAAKAACAVEGLAGGLRRYRPHG